MMKVQRRWLRRINGIGIALGMLFVAAGSYAQKSEIEADLFLPLKETMEILQSKKLTINTNTTRQALVDALVKVCDSGGRIISKEEAEKIKKEREGYFSSPGIMVQLTNGHSSIMRLLDASPAKSAGIKMGNKIVRVNETPTKSLQMTEIINLLRGPVSETVSLELANAGGATNVVEVGRALLREPAVYKAEKIPGDLAYVRLNGLYKGRANKVLPILRKWSKSDQYGMILDLRGADGNNLEAVAEIAGLYAQEGDLLFSFRDFEDQDLSVFKASSDEVLNMPTMVLIDQETTGAAEVLAAVMQNSVKGAMLVGEQTGGDMLVREFVPMNSGGYLYVATRQLALADGEVYRGQKGLVPNIRVVPAREIREEYVPESMGDKNILDKSKLNRHLRQRVRKDPALSRAVDVLLGLKALKIKIFGQSSNSTN